MARVKTRNCPSHNAAIDAKAKRMADTLRSHHELGLAALDSDLSTRLFADAHGMTEHTMRKIKAFAREYSRAELADMCRLRRPNGLPLQWGFMPTDVNIFAASQRLE